MTLSPTQAAILSAAARHPERLAAPPPKLAPAPRDAVRKSLLARGLIAPTAEAIDPTTAWTADATLVNYRITEAGLRAVGAETAAGADASDSAPSEATEAVDAPEAVHTTSRLVAAPPQAALQMPAKAASALRTPGALRSAAQAVLAAWDDEASGRAGPADAMAALRAVLAGKPARAPRDTAGARQPREGTNKREAVLALLHRPEGASGPQIIAATGWAPHTVRGFLAALKKRGVAVLVHDRVRQAGPGKAGAKGSYTIYRIAEAG